jgi:DNA-binding response OmpR family regulator
MAAKILLVEDDAAFRKSVRGVLKLHDYEVSETATGKKGIEITRADLPDLVVLDMVLPGIGGLDVCQALKQSLDTAGVPILILTGEDQEGQEVACLDMGADDYLTKPVQMEVLLAHVRALLRRFGGTTQIPAADLRKAGLDFDYDGKVVIFNGKKFPHLTPKEFGLLWELAHKSPTPQSREFLYKKVWGMDPPSKGALKTVEVHVRRIRLKLGWRADEWLVGVSGRGYVLAAPKK